MNPYEKLLNRKRTWTPVQTTKGKFKHGQKKPSTVLLQYAIWNYQLATFISEALSEIPEKLENFLESNVKDEIKHDLALDTSPTLMALMTKRSRGTTPTRCLVITS
ncbi:MAG: hypothetical protein CM15mP103_08590 [Gammaproteobacteria bacterium]|nr:MAG: hypothetical protein CM15mP103_08590 [Gammaproteobacteria bacterium]